MSVEIVNLQGGHGAGLVTAFSDNFQVPDQPQLIGDLWSTTSLPTGVTSSVDSVASRVNRAGAGLNVSGGGGGTIQAKYYSVPLPLSFGALNGKAQFAEAKLISDTSAGAGVIVAGPCVLIQQNLAVVYNLRINPAGVASATVRIVKTVGGVDTNVGAAVAIAAGNTIRIEVRPAGGTNFFTVLINGVIQNTSSDVSNALGMPGFGISLLAAGGQIAVFSNFACGKL